MSAHSVILYVHIVATLLLSVALAIETLILRHMRRAPSLAAARAWIDSVPRLRSIASGSLAGLMLSGIYLTVRMSAWTLTWARLAVLSLLLFGALIAVAFRRLRAIRSGNSQPELMRRLRDPVLNGSLGLRTGLLLGIVLLMTAKPGAPESLAIFAASLILGLLLGRLSLGRLQPEE